jgi:tetratricopeptide (TPR) repeat protein
MAAYYRGWAASQAGDVEEALAYFKEAAGLPPDYCFPNRVEAVLALREALWLNPGDPRAPYYLGNFWYAHRQYDQAIEMWERARMADPDYATPYRNLGLAAMNKQGDPESAVALYERAFALDKSDARVLFELDQLYKKTGKAPGERLAFLEEHLELVDQRDDLTVERVALLNQAGQHEAALAILLGRTFHPWEGGEGKVIGQYTLSLVEIAKKRLGEGRFEEAVDCLERACVYPDNLGEGKLALTPENHIDYFLGLAYEGLGDTGQARACFERASVGSLEPVSPLYYNDQPPEMIFYQGLALGRLGRDDEAESIFERLVGYGREHLDDRVTVDYFAVSLPDFLVFDDDLEQRNRVHCHFMMALGHLGLGQTNEAADHFENVLALAPHHLGAVVHKRMPTLIS